LIFNRPLAYFKQVVDIIKCNNDVEIRGMSPHVLYIFSTDG